MCVLLSNFMNNFSQFVFSFQFQNYFIYLSIVNLMMDIQPIQLSDIGLLNELQPPDWEDIKPHYKYYFDSPYCEPIKISIEDKIAGIGTTFKHRDTVWLAHIIVHPGFRKRGIGKMITDTLVKSVDRTKYETIYLTDTELSYPVYLKSGFEPESEYAHFEIEPGNKKPDVSPLIIPYDDKYKSEIFELDKVTTGEFREAILNVCIQSSFIFLANGKVSGAYFPQLGDGLIIADDPDTGIELMKFRLLSENEAVFHLENKTALEFYSEINAKYKKTSKRMRLGKKRIWHPENLYNRIGGQIG